MKTPTNPKENLIQNEEELLALLAEKDAKLEELENQVAWLTQRIEAMNKVKFGSKSEKVIDGQLNLFNEIEEFVDVTVVEPEVSKKKVKVKKFKEADFSKLPSVTIHHELKDTECKDCTRNMKELAPTVINVLKYQPAVYTIEKHVTHNYVCKPCTDDSDLMVTVSAPGAPARLIEGSIASSSVIAGLVTDKFCKAIPLYRNEQELKRKGVPISRANMSNWLNTTCDLYLSDLYDVMKEDLKNQAVIHMDETTVTVLEDKKDGTRSKSYEWIMISGQHEENQIAIYQYNQTREHKFAQELLGNFSGFVQSDGYEAYQKIPNITNVGCMAHARRKFMEAMETHALHKSYLKLDKESKKSFLEKNPSYYNTVLILNKMSILFDQERHLIGLSAPERYAERKKMSEQVVKELFETIHGLKDLYPNKSKMGVAITYAINNEIYLRNYLLDGRLELSNNRAERAVKPFVIGRKNWLFSNSKNGAQTSSIYYSIIETTKLNNLDPHMYLEYVLDELSNIPKDKRKAAIRNLLPYSISLPSTIRAKS